MSRKTKRPHNVTNLRSSILQQITHSILKENHLVDQFFGSHLLKGYTFPKTNAAREKWAIPKGHVHLPKFQTIHHFQGAFLLLVSGRLRIPPFQVRRTA